jgi:FAD dependent oxidoreductase TIGR03364
LVWVSGRRSGEELGTARRARARWEQVAAEVPGIGFRPMASLTVACSDAERTVMQTFARSDDAAARSITFLGPGDVTSCNPAVAGSDLMGALYCAEDAVVEPRQVPGALRAHLQTTTPDRYEFHPRHRVAAVEPHTAIDTTGARWSGDIVVLATGAAYDHLPGSDTPDAVLRRVRLQMLETAPFAPRLTTSLADADTLRYYPAYAAAPLDTLGEQSTVAQAHQLQLLLVQRPDGSLTIGDTHAYDEPFDFALAEEPTEELLSRAERILGVPLPPVRRRWAGVYAQCRDGRVCLRDEIRPGVHMVTGPGGRGMTCAPAIAADTLVAAGIDPVATAAGPSHTRPA